MRQFVAVQSIEDKDTQDKYATICKHYLTSVSAMFDSLLFLVDVLVLSVAKGLTSNVDTVIAETFAGKGNITSSVKLSADELLQAGEQFPGGGYKELGSGVFRSSNGLRQFRIDDNSLLGKHPPDVPHGHLETYAPGVVKPTTNNHIPFFD